MSDKLRQAAQQALEASSAFERAQSLITDYALAAAKNDIGGQV